LCLTTYAASSKIQHGWEKTKGGNMAGLVFWTAKRRKRLAALAAKGLTAREIAPRLVGTEHAPTAEAIRKTARLYGIRLLNQGGRPPKRKRGKRRSVKASGTKGTRAKRPTEKGGRP